MDTSLNELQAAFDCWRKSKQHRSQKTPLELLNRAKEAASMHGVGKIAELLDIDRKCLSDGQVEHAKKRRSKAPALGFSKLAIASSHFSQPLVEIETLRGHKMRIFSLTTETIGFLSSILGEEVIR